MKKYIITAVLFFTAFPTTLLAQQQYIEPGTSVVIKEITSWDPIYSSKDKIIGKEAKVGGKGIIHVGDSHYFGTVIIDAKEYELLDVKLEIKQNSKPLGVVKDKSKLERDLKKVMNFFIDDFTPIRTAITKKDYNPQTKAYHSSLWLHGSIDSSNTVYYNGYNKTWNFKTLIDPKLFNSKEIISLLETTIFSFGKLEKQEEKERNDLKDYYYAPVDRKKPGSKFRKLTIHLYVDSYKDIEGFIQLSILNDAFEKDVAAVKPTSSAKSETKDIKKLETGFKKLLDYFQNDFTAIKSNKKIKNYDREQAYRSTFQLHGAKDSSIIFFDTTARSWNFEIQMDPQIYNSKDICQILDKMTFSFGKLEKQKLYEGSNTITYLPDDRKKLKTKFKDLNINIFFFEINGSETILQINVYRQS